jgi:outer membrane biosynthesis protein TonB
MCRMCGRISELRACARVCSHLSGESMNRLHGRVGMVAAVALLAGAAACSNTPQTVDAAFAADLKAASGSGVELAPRGNPAQVVVSPLEGGPTSAPAKTPRQVKKPSTHAVTRVASRAEEPAQAPAPEPVVQQQTPTPQPAPVQQAPVATPAPAPATRPIPVRSQQRQPGTYKTEAEIFRQMPWIRP